MHNTNSAYTLSGIHIHRQKYSVFIISPEAERHVLCIYITVESYLTYMCTHMHIIIILLILVTPHYGALYEYRDIVKYKYHHKSANKYYVSRSLDAKAVYIIVLKQLGEMNSPDNEYLCTTMFLGQIFCSCYIYTY